MDFRPEINDRIQFDQPYVFMEHPAAPGIPYGQKGRRGTVYQIRSETDRRFYALKVFTENFQDPRNAAMAQHLKRFSHLPGLEVCSRKVILPGQYPNLVGQYPQLGYAVLMPWVDGETWYDKLLVCEPLEHDQSYALASSLLHCLMSMERRQIAHCDLSGANVMIQAERTRVVLVDVEEMYSSDLQRPDPKKLPAGTPGYAHKTAARGLWSQEADRFAGAVLIAEMLGWSSERIRQSACEAQYFEADEEQTHCPRYQTMREVLRREWGSPISDLFARAWFSPKISDCPSFEQWAEVLRRTSKDVVLVETEAVDVDDRAPDPEETSSPGAVAPRIFSEATAMRVDEDRAFTPAPARRHGPTVLPSFAWGVVSWARVNPRWSILLVVLLLLLTAGGAGAWLAVPRGNASYSGQVLDSESKQPLQAQVTLNGGGFRRSVSADSSGRFTFTRLPALQGEIQVTMDGYTGQVVPVRLAEGEIASAPPVELVLTGYKVIGQVVNSVSGEAVSSADVQVSGTDSATGREFRVSGKTESDGKYAIILPGQPEKISIQLRKSGYQPYTSNTLSITSKIIEIRTISFDPVP